MHIVLFYVRVQMFLLVCCFIVDGCLDVYKTNYMCTKRKYGKVVVLHFNTWKLFCARSRITNKRNRDQKHITKKLASFVTSFAVSRTLPWAGGHQRLHSFLFTRFFFLIKWRWKMPKIWNMPRTHLRLRKGEELLVWALHKNMEVVFSRLNVGQGNIAHSVVRNW